MADLVESMFHSFDTQFAPKLQTFLQSQRMHQTNKDALRCFLISMLINAFEANTKHVEYLSAGYIASTPDCIFFLAVLKDQPSTGRFLDFFVFHLAAGENREPIILAARSKDTLVAMFLGDKLFSLLAKKKLPKAKIVSLEDDADCYTVRNILFLKPTHKPRILKPFRPF